MRDTVSSLLVGAVLAAPLALLPPAEAGPPAQLALARYVALGYDRGDRFVSVTDVRTDFLLEERAALQTIRAEIERWERYVVVDRPGQADLLIAVPRFDEFRAQVAKADKVTTKP